MARVSKNFVLDVSQETAGYRFEMYVPILDQKKKVIPTKHFRDLKKDLVKAFKGCSFDYPFGGSGGIDGVWYSGETKITYYDKNAVFVFWTAQDPGCIDWVRRLKKKWQKSFNQEVLVVSMHGIQVI